MSRTPFESKVQNLVYHLEVGVGAGVLRGLLYVLFMVVLSVLYMANQYVGFDTPRAMDQAQLARSVSETGRLETRVLRPASLRRMKELGRLGRGEGALSRHPDLVNAPGWPLVVGAAFRVSGTEFPAPTGVKYAPENWVVVPLGLLLNFLTGACLYVLARSLFDARVALTALSVFWLSNAVWAPAVAGTELPLALFLHTIAFLCLLPVLRAPEGTAVWRRLAAAALGGLALGLAFLTRYAAAASLPGYLLVLGVGLKRRGILPALAALVAFLLPVWPWVHRNLQACGLPFGLAPRLSLLPESQDLAARSLHLDLAPDELGRQVLSRLMRIFTDVLSLRETGFGSGLVLCFFVVAFLFKFQRPPVRVLRWGGLAGYGVLLLAAAVFGTSQLEAALLYLPLVVVYGCAFFHLMLDRLQIGVRIVSLAAVWGFVLVQALPMIAEMMPPRPSSHPPYFAPDTGSVARLFGPNELLVSDMPWATAWYGRALSLQLPATIDDFYEIHDTVQPVRGLYLTQITRNLRLHDDLVAGPSRSWRQIAEATGLPRGFPVPMLLPLRGGAQLLFADSPRWVRPAP